MKKTAIVFPGQGSQKVGMGKELMDYSTETSTLLKQAFDFLGDPFQTICFEGPQDTLNQTQYAQPLIFLISAVLFNALKKQNITPSFIAGHSLGELTAYYASGCLNLQETLTLIKKRGEVMAASHPSEDSAMCAILGSSKEIIENIVANVTPQPVVAANYNCPNQIVISGKKDGVIAAKSALSQEGAKCIDLPVSGAFHSPLMKSGSDALKEYIKSISLNDAQTPLILNKSATPETNASLLTTNIYEQVISSVKWTQTIQFLESNGIELIIECGPGKVLTGLIKKTTSIPVVSINSIESLESIHTHLEVKTA